jgi:hypothetical protein
MKIHTLVMLHVSGELVWNIPRLVVTDLSKTGGHLHELRVVYLQGALHPGVRDWYSTHDTTVLVPVT